MQIWKRLIITVYLNAGADLEKNTVIITLTWQKMNVPFDES